MQAAIIMNLARFSYAIKSFIVVVLVAFAAQIAVTMADPSYQEVVNQLAPVNGVALGLLIVWGYRYLPWIFVGALLPALFEGHHWLLMLSVPVATTVSAALSRVLISLLKIDCRLEKIRDTLLLLLIGGVAAPLIGALMQALLVYLAKFELVFGQFDDLLLSLWLASGVGSVICFPFVLAWANREGFSLGLRQMGEVFLWLVILILFGYITFENWAPTDVLLYPMELAIFPIMAWGGIRLGLRGATAGVLVLALVAAWELIPVLGEVRHISQSPANVWIFVAIVSVTSVCLASVMTELRAREAEVSENEGRLSAFTQALPDIAFVLTADGVIRDAFASGPEVEANHRVVNAQTVRGKRLEEVFDVVTARQFVEVVREVLATNRLQTCEYQLESVDVGRHWFEARVSPMFTGSGQADRVVWVAYNITGRKDDELAIQQRDGILQSTALANNALLTNRDFHTGVESAIREVGMALRADRVHLFEITDPEQSREYAFSCSFEWRENDAVPSLMYEDAEAFNGSMEVSFPGWYAVLDAQQAIRVESASESNEDIGSVLAALKCKSLIAVPLRVEQRLYGFLAVSFCEEEHCWGDGEVNALWVLASSLSGLLIIQGNEEALKLARDRADAASVAKGEFLAMMSHEIRTPMNAIIGYTDLLRQTDLDELQVEQAAVIKRSGKALLDLINNILDYSKIESKTLELDRAPVDVEQVVCEALEFILPVAKEKGVVLDFEISEEVSEQYWGDPHRLRQILMNLASNAVKFTREGSIRIQAELSESGLDFHRLHFVVVDTGCGIPEDKFDRLFQPFSQVDSSTTRKFGGTGLGLVISQRLIERMDGRIWVESELGVGTSFHFEVRLSRSAELSQTRAPFTKQSVVEDSIDVGFAKDYPLRLLFCEDDEDNRWVVSELLQSLGYAVDVVDDAEQAIQFLAKADYDVVLMDVQLPGISGLELTQQMRSGELGVALKGQYVVAVTAFALREDRESCLQAGMNDYLRKPLEIANLKDVLISAYKRLKT